MREAEMKFGVPPDFRLPSLQGLGDDVRPVPGATLRYRTTYHDTPDLRLLRWGVTLRYRDGEGWITKLREPGEAGLVVRAEHPFEGDPSSPPAEALDLLRGYLRGAAVEPVAVLRAVRRRVELRSGSDGPVAEVMDDRVAVMDGDRQVGEFHEVEVEVHRHEPAVDGLRRRLEAAGAFPPPAGTKLARALGPAADRPSEVAVPDPPPDSPADRVILGALAASVTRLMTHDPGVRLDRSPEDVHQARVATRRLRSDLRTFGSLLDTGWTGDLRHELGWLGDLLGRVRDMDVLREHLGGAAAGLPPDEAGAAAAIIRRFGSVRRRARKRLLEAMRTERYDRLLEALVEAARDPRWAPGADRDDVAALLAPVSEAWDRLARAARKKKPSDERLHRIRIRAKRFRYASEAVEPVAGEPARAAARAASKLQDVLGENQDMVVAQAWLREHPGSTVEEAFCAGRMAEALAAGGRSARSGWRKAWKRLRKEAPPWS